MPGRLVLICQNTSCQAADRTGLGSNTTATGLQTQHSGPDAREAVQKQPDHSSPGVSSDAQAAQGPEASVSGQREQEDSCTQQPKAAEDHRPVDGQHQDSMQPNSNRMQNHDDRMQSNNDRIQQHSEGMQQLPQRSRRQRRQSSSHRSSDGQTQQGLITSREPVGSDGQDLCRGGAADGDHKGKSSATVNGKQVLCS